MAPNPSYKVLLVDDDVDLLDLFGTMLSRKAYQVLKASSSKEAFSILETNIPDVIVLDLAMPDMNGIEFMRRVRSIPRLSTIKIIVVTAVPVMLSKEDHDRANLVITKPITPSGLEEAIRNLLTS
jgi:CheY-like chemotaxis protein